MKIESFFLNKTLYFFDILKLYNKICSKYINLEDI